jgi:hypothetical protein
VPIQPLAIRHFRVVDSRRDRLVSERPTPQERRSVPLSVRAADWSFDAHSAGTRGYVVVAASLLVFVGFDIGMTTIAGTRGCCASD